MYMMSDLNNTKEGGKKRFRQTTLEFSFKRRKSDLDVVNTSTDATMNLQQESETRRTLLAAAAERRMETAQLSQEQGSLPLDNKEANHLNKFQTKTESSDDKCNLPTSMQCSTNKSSEGEAGLTHCRSPEEGPSNFVEGSDENEASPTLEYSQCLFSESDSQEDSQPIEQLADLSGDGVCFGTPLSQLRRAPQCSATLPPLKPDRNLKIMFRPDFTEGLVPRSFPDQFQDRWDSVNVRMPCSPQNLYPVEGPNGKKEVKSRWELIESSLLNDISTSIDLEESILVYNTRYNKRWNFEAIHHYFTDILDRDESSYFFESILPGIVQVALQLPKICTQPIPLLKKDCNQTVFLSQHQIASLLANAFFCTFPRRNAQVKKSEYSNYPDINFNRLFGGRYSRKQEKFKCIFNYFKRVITTTPCGTVSFTRRSLNPCRLPDWAKSQTKLGRLHVSSKGMIETLGVGMLQLDFANKFVGGGVLGNGCVQEEIRFLICPELIVSRLFTEVLGPHECLIIKGVEQYSSFSGYADSFKWTGNVCDKTPRDKWGRRETELVALDALHFHQSEQQYHPDKLKRELNKAFCGFYGDNKPAPQLPAIATGNWGCGAFRGDPRLKALLQLMAAAETERDVAYFTFNDDKLCQDIYNMYEFLQSQAVSVGELWTVLCKYNDHIQNRSKQFHPKLYPYILEVFTNYDSDTDDETVPQNKPEEDASLDYKENTP